MAGSIDELMSQYDDGQADDAAGFDDPNDPEITVGRSVQLQQRSGRSRQSQGVMGPIADTFGIATVPTPVRKKKSEAMKDFYRLETGDLKTLQERLFKAGYYGNLKPQQIRWGTHDPTSAKAYADLLENVAAQNTADPNRTLDEVLDIEAQAMVSSGRESERTILNPEDTKATAQAVAQNLIGRRIDDETANQVAMRAQAAVDAYGSVPDSRWLEEQLRQLMPQSTAAFQTAGNAGSFMKMLDTQGQFSAYYS